MHNTQYFEIKDFILNISAISDNLIFKGLNRVCNTTWDAVIDCSKTFPFCDDSKEALEATALCIKEGNIYIDDQDQERILIDLEYNLYYKKKKISIILKRNLEKSTLVDSINFCKSRINEVYKEFNVRFRELKSLFDDEIITLNNYCREMFSYITSTLENTTKTVNNIASLTNKHEFMIDALNKRISNLEDKNPIENIGYIKYQTNTLKTPQSQSI